MWKRAREVEAERVSIASSPKENGGQQWAALQRSASTSCGEPRGPSPDREDVGCLWGVVREPVRTADKHHITGKPTPVMQQLVRICPRGGLVLDPFAGSGTTGVAALLEDRRFIGDRDHGRLQPDRS